MTAPDARMWVLVDLGWEDGDEEIVAVYDSEESAEAERSRRGGREYRVFGPVPFNPPIPDA